MKDDILKAISEGCFCLKGYEGSSWDEGMFFSKFKARFPASKATWQDVMNVLQEQRLVFYKSPMVGYVIA